MKSTHVTMIALAAAACFAVAGFARVEPEAGDKPELTERVEQWFADHPTGRLYIQLDKPLYQPGETIWFKASIFETATLRQFSGSAAYECELVDPRGSKVLRKRVKMTAGSGENDLVIPDGVAGGEYTLKVRCLGGPEDERPVVISVYEAPKFKKKLDVLGKGYGAGDRVEAKAEFRRGTGEPLAATTISVVATVDGAEAYRAEPKTDAEGKLAVAFDLPAKIQTDNAFLTLKVTSGGLTESISRSIPILLEKLNVDFYPEGGDLVQGISSRVYFQALKPNGKPAEVAGVVVDGEDREVARLKSFHHGMGRFEFTPQADRKYRLKVTSPVGVDRTYPLPAAKAIGVVMRTRDDVEGRRTDVELTLTASEPMADVTVLAVVRERLQAVALVDLVAGENRVVLHPDAGQGTMRLTALDANGTPLCERLVYRGRRQDMQVTITAAKDHYMPREEVALTIRTTLANGKACPAELCLAVVDDRVLTYADDKTSHILTHLYLEKELPGKIEEPNFYFDPEEGKSAEALELLMGTRGWRRFQWRRALDSDAGKSQDVRVADQLIRKALETAARDRVVEFGARRGAGQEGLAAGGEIDVVDAAIVDFDGVAAPGIDPDEAAPMPMPIARPAVPPEDLAVPAADPPAAEPVAPMAPPPVLALEAQAMEKNDEIAMDEEVPARKKLRAEADAVVGRWNEFGDRDARMRQRAAAWALVRQFPKVAYETTKTDVRSDFRETLLWQPRVVTDERGMATVAFHLSDAVTSFRVVAEGGADDGLPGRGELVVDSRTPMHMEAKMPVVLTAGDIVELPVVIGNETDAPLALVGQIELPDFLGVRDPGVMEQFSRFSVAANDAQTFYLPLLAKPGKGAGSIAFTASAAGLSDKLRRSVRVVPAGFPVEQSLNATVDKTESFALELPEGIVPGSLAVSAKFYPSPLATVLAGLESILREPNGCFEQTSSSAYPNIMVLSYLRETGKIAPDIEKRASELVARGYKRLVGYECKQKGFEWFGGDPGHEALTAYGIMEFVDMAKVYDGVDPKMITRTAKWLLAQRNAKGGFKRNPRALDSFGRASEDVTDAYIVWALTEARIDGLDREIESVVKRAYESKNAYLIALAAIALGNTDATSPDIPELLELLASHKTKDGAYTTDERSITGSSGRNLHIETTALAILAQLRGGRPAAEVRSSVEWLVNGRSGGGFGSTQATILALKAMLAYADASRTVQSDGDIALRVNGTLLARKHFNKGDQGVITIDGLEAALNSGNNDIDVELISAMELPCSVDVSYKTTTPNSAADCPVRLEIARADKPVAMGDVVDLAVTLSNATDEGQPMTLARIGVPAGLSPQLWQLKELREKGLVDFYETTEREIVLYYRSLKPGEIKKLNVQLRADLPGTYSGVASSAYLYYSADRKWWIDPVQVAIAQ